MEWKDNKNKEKKQLPTKTIKGKQNRNKKTE